MKPELYCFLLNGKTGLGYLIKSSAFGGFCKKTDIMLFHSRGEGKKEIGEVSSRFIQRAAKRGEAIYDDIREKVRVSEVVHADETSWRNDGKGSSVWFAGKKYPQGALAPAERGAGFCGLPLLRPRHCSVQTSL